MPCSCFGKKDKKGVGPLKKEEEGYHPGDFRERDPLVKAGSGLTPPFVEVKKQQQQQQQQLGSAPPAPVTPPSTPSAGETRLRPEDDTDKATRRRDVVASFYSDQCELIGFKTTGSRPSSAHVGGGHPDGPAATSSPATSSPSSTRSAGACCRADLAEKRREFFKDLANDDFSRGSRPTSRLTDPGSQQTPRNSHYQEQLHHTLPHHNKTSRSNIVSSHPLVLAQGIHRNSHPVSSPNTEENQYISLQSSPSPEQAPKMLHENPDLSVSKNVNRPSNEVVSEFKVHDDISSKTPLLLGNEEGSQMICETSMSTTVQKCSPIISHNSIDQPFPGTEQIVLESKSPELINIHPTEITLDKIEVKSSDTDIFLSPEPLGNVRTSIDNNTEVICDMLVSENSKSVDAPSDSKRQFHVMDAATSQNPQLTSESSCNGKQDIGMNVSVLESDPFINNEDLTFVVDNSQMTFSSANVNPFAQFGTPDSVVESYSGECLVPSESHDDQFSNKFSHETQPQIDLFDNKALKETLPREYEHSSFEVIPQVEEGPQTIVETTRQFISASSESPIQQNNSQTIVETTRQFITGPPEEQATKTLVEITRQFPSESSDELKSSQTIVETTRRFISGIPEDEQTPFILEDAAQQFMSEMPGNQINVKTTENFVSGSPDERITHTIVQTTQHLVSGSPDEQVTQTVVESSQQLFPSSNGKFFLTSVEELDDIPEKLMMQTGSATVMTSSTVTEKPVVSTRTQLTDVCEEKDEPQLPDVPCFGVPPPPPSPPSPFEEDPLSEDLFTSPVTVSIPPVEGEPLPPVPPLSNVEPGSPQFTSSVPDEEKDFGEFSLSSFELPLPQHDIQDREVLSTPPRPNLEDLQQLLPSSSPSSPSTPTSPNREDDILPTPPTPPTEKKMEASLLSTSICTTTTTTTTTVSSTPNVTCGVEIVSTSTLEDDGLGSEIDDALESIEGLSEEGNNIGRAAASS